MDLVIADLIDKSKAAGTLESDVSKNVKALKVDSKLKQSLNRTQKSMLKEGVKLGTQHAALEIDKAKKDSFSRKVDMSRLDLIAEDFFQTTAFKITGNLTDEAVKIIETEILNGSQYGKTWEEVEKSIYRSFATKGMITTEQAKDALGEALGVANPDARIRTITRTSTFDAINNARHSYFTDPQLGDFVQAFEYSAILDSRTTSICRHLDEEDRGNHSKEWYAENASYRPPNHFNCRSLLVPVTELDIDTFVEGGEPTIEPQEGFK
jgi:SPP1 gp7 family putative phage head morphogenesis protein